MRSLLFAIVTTLAVFSSVETRSEPMSREAWEAYVAARAAVVRDDPALCGWYRRWRTEDANNRLEAYERGCSDQNG